MPDNVALQKNSRYIKHFCWKTQFLFASTGHPLCSRKRISPVGLNTVLICGENSATIRHFNISAFAPKLWSEASFCVPAFFPPLLLFLLKWACSASLWRLFYTNCHELLTTLQLHLSDTQLRTYQLRTILQNLIWWHWICLIVQVDIFTLSASCFQCFFFFINARNTQKTAPFMHIQLAASSRAVLAEQL